MLANNLAGTAPTGQRCKIGTKQNQRFCAWGARCRLRIHSLKDGFEKLYVLPERVDYDHAAVELPFVQVCGCTPVFKQTTSHFPRKPNYMTYQRTQKKWQIVPASTKRCHTMCE